MDTTIEQYLQNQLIRGKERLQPNTVNGGGKPYPQRNVFTQIQSYIDDFISHHSQERWIVIPGLRGVGKTTVVSQLYLYTLQQHNVDARRLLYVSIDEVKELGGTVRTVIDGFEKILGTSYESLTEPVFIFFDEVQTDEKWALIIKSLYERSKKIFIICTGSSAVELQSTADSARRAVFIKMFPMNFTEFQMVKHGVYPTKNLKERIHQAVYASSSPQEAFERLQAVNTDVLQYWSKVDALEIQEFLYTGTLPFAIGHRDEYQVYQAINELLDQVIRKDIQALQSFDSDTLNTIKSLLFLLADSSTILSFSLIADTIGLQRPTLNLIFDALEKTELLIRALPYGSNKKKVTKPSKFLFTSPAVRRALLNIAGLKQTLATQQGMLLEDIVAMHFHREFVAQHIGDLTYDATEGGADFVLQIGHARQFVVEVGMGKKDTKQVRKTMEKVQSDYGIVISSVELQINDEHRVLFLPLKTFLLM